MPLALRAENQPSPWPSQQRRHRPPAWIKPDISAASCRRFSATIAGKEIKAGIIPLLALLDNSALPCSGCV
jgi:hypothetical protein